MQRYRPLVKSLINYGYHSYIFTNNFSGAAYGGCFGSAKRKRPVLCFRRKRHRVQHKKRRGEIFFLCNRSSCRTLSDCFGSENCVEPTTNDQRRIVVGRGL